MPGVGAVPGVGAGRVSGMRTRSAGDVAAAAGLHGRAAAAAAAAAAPAGHEGDDGCDSEHSMRSTGSHRRKALAPHRAGL
jgi:hypothetical protein